MCLKLDYRFVYKQQIILNKKVKLPMRWLVTRGIVKSLELKKSGLTRKGVGVMSMRICSMDVVCI